MNRGGQAGSGRPTIEDVAARAGVSIKTVSRVLNGERYVAAATAEKVAAAVAALGFRPNLAARALAGRRSFQIALVYGNPSPYFAHNLQAGVRARCAEQGYRMIAQPADADAPNLREEIAALVDQAQLDGLILTPPFTEHEGIAAELAARGLPWVATSPAAPNPARASVAIDNQAAAAAMTAHLVACGHRRIGFVKGDPRFAVSAMRLAGYKAALKAAGIGYDASLVKPGSFDFASGRAAAEALLALPEPPSAIFAASDDMAAGVLAAAHANAIAVPGALSVAGFDDTDLAAVVWPPLTTVHQPVRDLGYAAADLLLAPADPPEHRRLDFELVIRDSVAVKENAR
jgi:LacI family transcriptional regulator